MTPQDPYRIKLNDLIREGISDPAIVLTADLHLEEDLGIDSLDKWELLARIEKEFNISLGWESLQKVDTVRSLYDIVSDALNNL
ncbi:acyl carrier protein [Microcystis aeruginosa]|uniref:Carrier domain-containing protein n=2 Tax=Bacteria TaxID=2 RepID=A8YM16_MICA7|nr:acyl carrier protein [Microcystis aeruginosa]CAO91235.1 unnamed protein product [Microcystis aeruginosa PCC 7806]